jgi:hypothetical protein
MIGDILCGRAAGVRTIRVAADRPVPEPSQPTAADRTARDLADAASSLGAADRLAGVPPGRPVG